MLFSSAQGQVAVGMRKSTFKVAKPINRFDVDLYFKLTEKITFLDSKLIVSLLDGSEVECEIE